MSIFGSILSKIFHHGEAQAAPAPQPGATPPSDGPGAAPAPSAPAPSDPAPSASATESPIPAPAAPGQSAPQGGTTGATVDVGAVLDGLAAKNSQKLDWRHSIVDMMKLLDLDSSLTARKALAEELHYTGDTDDSATMNLWLHKQVMGKLAANGGKVPDDLKD